MNAMIANNVTGEVFSTYGKVGIKELRGVIRQWMKDGLNIHDFDVLEWSSIPIYRHLREYAWNKSQHPCDVCDKVITCEETIWLSDKHDVCLVALCPTCHGIES